VVAVRVAPSPRAACVSSAAAAALAGGAGTDPRIFAARSDEVESLRVVAPDGSRMDLARAGSGFRLREPESRELGSEEADAAGALVAAMVDAEGVPSPDTGDEASAGRRGAASIDAGTKDETRLFLTRAGGGGTEEVRVDALGAVRVADGVGLALSPDAVRLLRPGLAALRPRRVLSEALRHVPVVGVATSCGPVSQEARRERDGWTLRAPKGVPADGAAALELADAVLGARAVRHLDAVAFTPRCEVTITFEEGAAPVRVEFAADAMARVADDVFVPPPELRPMAGRLMVDRHVFHVDPRDVVAASLQRGGHTRMLDASALDPLDGLRAEAALSLGPATEAPSAVLRITLRPRDAATPVARTFTFGGATVLEGRRVVLARTSAVEATYALPADRLAPLLDAP